MPVVATAGHVDHGKSTLILALTGRDPDRLADEKRRGLTIDLGFAWMTLPDGEDVSFVDVPGHEDFMKNMLAGTAGIDAALLVVAADEGWKPQTEEHVAVLDLLGIARGIVAVTKADRVDQATAGDVTAEVEQRLQGTTLAGCPIFPLSAVTGYGLPELTQALAELVSGLPALDFGRPRLWVDRVFTVDGVGTVVTGTLVEGPLSVGDEIMIWPGAVKTRIRSLQTHERSTSGVEPGRRSAIGLVGTGRANVRRGHMLGASGHWNPTNRVLARYRLARYTERLPERGAYHSHIGSSSQPARLRVLDDQHLVMELGESVCLKVGDRFIIRDVGRQVVVAGGVVLDPAPSRGRRLAASMTVLGNIETVTPDIQAERLLRVRRRDLASRLSAHTGGGRSKSGVEADGVRLSEEEVERLGAAATRLVADHHAQQPLEGGPPAATIASQLGTSPNLLERIIDRSPVLAKHGPIVAEQSHQPSLSADNLAAWQEAERQLRSQWPEPPSVAQLSLSASFLHYLVSTRQVIKIANDLYLLPDQMELLTATLKTLPDPFTVAQFRQRAGVSRKYAVPFLQWADSQGLTRRDGDLRYKSGGERESNPPGTNTAPQRF